MNVFRVISISSYLASFLCFYALCAGLFTPASAIDQPTSRKLFSKLVSDVIPVVSEAPLYSSRSLGYLNEGNLNSKLPDKISLYCRALSMMGLALSDEPYNSRYLLNWANIRQLLGSTNCSEPLTTGDMSSVIEGALKSSPKDPSVLYSAGLIFLWSDNKTRARELFREVIRFGLPLTFSQESIILSSITSPDEILSVVPAQFPHVIRWQEILHEYPVLQDDEAKAIRTDEIIGKLQIEALSKNRAELQSHLISEDIFEQRLLELLDANPSSTARRFIDSELANTLFSDSSTNEHKFFLDRSGLDEFGIVRSFLTLDSRPLKTPFVKWDIPEKVNFASSYNSVGFFLPPGHSVSLIALESQIMSVDLSASEIKVYVSDDNQEWREISDTLKLKMLRVIDFPWIAIYLKEPLYAPYWKVHISGTEKSRQFVNRLDNLIRVFGDASIHD